MFAAPLALSDLEGDANVPPTTDDGVRAACDVRGPKVVNVCELRDRGPVVIVFTVTRSNAATDQVDVVERLRPRFPKISFAAVAVKGNREEVRKLVRENGWGLPVAHDRDGAVANNYGVAICPTMTLAGSDGKVAATTLGYQTGRAALPPPRDPEVSDAGPQVGWVEPQVAAEFADLRLYGAEAPGASRPFAARRQGAPARQLSDSFRGAQAIQMRQQPIPWAYRVFFRHIGLDPDEERTPVEAAALQRLIKGGYRSQGLLEDALTIAVVETGVPVWALDADKLRGPLGIRQATLHEPFGDGPDPFLLPAGRLLVADELGPAAVLFGDVAPGREVTKSHASLAAVHGPGDRCPGDPRRGGALAGRGDTRRGLTARRSLGA